MSLINQIGLNIQVQHIIKASKQILKTIKNQQKQIQKQNSRTFYQSARNYYQKTKNQKAQENFKLNILQIKLKSLEKNKLKKHKQDGKCSNVKQNNLGQILKQQKQLYSLSLQKNSQIMNTIYTEFKYKINKYKQCLKKQTKILTNDPLQNFHQKKIDKEFLNLPSMKTYKNLTKLNSFGRQQKQRLLNLFTIQTHKYKCVDSIFPMIRNGATLINYQDQIYLYGGVNFKFAKNNSFHKLSLIDNKWKKLQQKGNKPNNSPSFHTVQCYKNYLFFIGGIYFSQNKNSKTLNPDINFYNIQNAQWSKIQWRIYVRSHASTIYDNMLVIYGGINQYDHYSNNIHFLSLDFKNLSMTMTNTMQNKNQGLAFHKIVNTYDVSQNIKIKMLNDGIFCFGGKFYNENLNNNDLYLYRFSNQKRYPNNRDWQIVKTNGIKPQPRYNHSMNILPTKGLIFIIGGYNSQAKVIGDSWIFDLTTSTWLKALYIQKLNLLNNGLASHCSTIMNDQIFIFSGINNQSKQSNILFSIGLIKLPHSKKKKDLQSYKSNQEKQKLNRQSIIKIK